jgi:putative methyltransferase
MERAIQMIFFLNRLLKKVNWYNLRSLEPMSRVFGLDRGMPIDRFYIEDFLYKNRSFIKGTVCEIAENGYSKKFGSNVAKFEILHYTNDNKNATIVGDLTNISTIPREKIDCFILTQTLNFIYDFKSAIAGLHHMLKQGGIGLVTVAGISQISRYDMDRWGDYWRFTDLSIKRAFEDVFGEGNAEVEIYGNILSSTAFLQGISAQELTRDELFYIDRDYQVTIAVKAFKR